MGRDAEEVRVGGNRVQDATMSHTRRQDAQDAQDANLTSPVSGCKLDACDANYIFADVSYLQGHCKDQLGDWTDEFVSSLAYSCPSLTKHQPDTAEITGERGIKSCTHFSVYLISFHFTK